MDTRGIISGSLHGMHTTRLQRHMRSVLAPGMHQTMRSQAVGGAQEWCKGSAHQQLSLQVVHIDSSTCARIAMNQRLNYNHVGSEHAGMQGECHVLTRV
jgi:hypothetical protein